MRQDLLMGDRRKREFRSDAYVEQGADRPCGQCGEVLLSTRAKYHPECLPAVRAAAQSAQKRCGRCKVSRASSSFVNDATRADGKYPWCVDCQKDSSARRRFQASDEEPNGHVCPLCDTVVRGSKNRRYCSDYCKYRIKSLKRNFGLNVDQYRAMIAATGGSCPLCGCRPSKWVVDHDHATGLITGVVCTPCNVGILAHSRHDVARVDALRAYLVDTPAQRIGIVLEVPEHYRNTRSNIHKVWERANSNVKPEGS